MAEIEVSSRVYMQKTAAVMTIPLLIKSERDYPESTDVRLVLTEHEGYLAGKVTFLLDANLGMINIEQSAIIKIFSVAAVVFLPPTMIASIYGMNFEFMPELGWRFGYLFAIIAMTVSMIIPLWYFRRKRWI